MANSNSIKKRSQIRIRVETLNVLYPLTNSEIQDIVSWFNFMDQISAVRLIERMQFDPKIEDFLKNELQLIIWPDAEQIAKLRDELIYQRRKLVDPKFMVTPKNFKVELEPHINYLVYDHIQYKLRNLDTDKRNKMIFLIHSNKDEYQFGGLKLIGFYPEAAKFLLNQIYEVRKILDEFLYPKAAINGKKATEEELPQNVEEEQDEFEELVKTLKEIGIPLSVIYFFVEESTKEISEFLDAIEKLNLKTIYQTVRKVYE